jgi:hypothetical protein
MVISTWEVHSYFHSSNEQQRTKLDTCQLRIYAYFLCSLETFYSAIAMPRENSNDYGGSREHSGGQGNRQVDHPRNWTKGRHGISVSQAI